MEDRGFIHRLKKNINLEKMVRTAYPINYRLMRGAVGRWSAQDKLFANQMDE